jgi:GT2 family glycosyltransferase
MIRIPDISAVIVTWNSAQDLVRVLGSLRLQRTPLAELIVVDNASTDDSLDKLRRHWPSARVIRNESNLGFAAAANQGITAARHDFVLLVNPDIECQPTCVERLVRSLARHPDVALVGPKLLRFDKRDGLPVIDSAGIVMTCDLRHLDRGADETDRGQYDKAAYVFGISGALMLLNRERVRQIAIDGRFFDERFHSYREDADLAWRVQLAGLRCLFCPSAVALHKRRVTPQRRRELPTFINRNSVRNRFLMRANNLTPSVWLKTAIPAALRDLLVLGACLTIERSSLSGLIEVFQSPRELLRYRRKVMDLKRPGVDVARWFDGRMVEELNEEDS